MSYTMDCLKTGFPEALELLLDCVLNPAFEATEVEDQKARLLMLLGGKDIHATLMTEVRHTRTRDAHAAKAASFRASNPMGNFLLPAHSVLCDLTWLRACFLPPR